jgi:multidrug resistance efflux pump
VNRLLILAVCTALCACQTTNPHLNEGKAIAASYSALNAAYTTADTLAKSGALHGAQAATVKSDLDQAKASLDSAETIYRLNPSSDVSSQLTSAAALIAQVLTITQQAKK